MKIHFAAFIGVDFDLDLSRYWIAYYQSRKFDSYTVFLHRANGAVSQTVQALYRDAGFSVLCVDGSFSDGMAKSVHLRNFARNLPKDNFLVTADGDEFQAMPDGSPINYRLYCLTHDIIHGLFEERYSYNLENCFTDPFVQYLNCEPYTGEYIKLFVPPFLDAKNWKPLARTKILAARAGYDVMYSGCHIVNGIPANARIFFNCKVIHFSWRESTAKKLAIKSYFSLEALREAFLDAKLPITEKVENEMLSIKSLVSTDNGDFLQYLLPKGDEKYALQN